MEVVLALGAAALLAIGAIGLHISASQSSSTTSYIPEASNDTTDEKATLVFLAFLLRGIVLIESKIANSKAIEEQERQERIESISSSLGGAATSIAINSAQDIISGLKDGSVLGWESERISTDINDVVKDISNPLAIPNQFNPPDIGPVGTPPFVPPDIGPVGTPPLVPPDIGPIGTPPLNPPVVGSKEFGDNILWIKNNLEVLPNQGIVKGNIEGAPPIDAGKQGKHVPGHNNNNPSKSQWPQGENGIELTQEAWQKGTVVKPDGTVKIYDFEKSVGSNGETRVKVHIDSNGNLHGYPVK